jgi:hypothetical protein
MYEFIFEIKKEKFTEKSMEKLTAALLKNHGASESKARGLAVQIMGDQAGRGTKIDLQKYPWKNANLMVGRKNEFPNIGAGNIIIALLFEDGQMIKFGKADNETLLKDLKTMYKLLEPECMRGGSEFWFQGKDYSKHIAAVSMFGPSEAKKMEKRLKEAKKAGAHIVEFLSDGGCLLVMSEDVYMSGTKEHTGPIEKALGMKA